MEMFPQRAFSFIFILPFGILKFCQSSFKGTEVRDLCDSVFPRIFSMGGPDLEAKKFSYIFYIWNLNLNFKFFLLLPRKGIRENDKNRNKFSL